MNSRTERNLRLEPLGMAVKETKATKEHYPKGLTLLMTLPLSKFGSL